MSDKRFLVWDLPTRLFHWLLVLCVTGSVISGLIGGNLIDWHGCLGLAIVALVTFRLAWGLIGSTYARFAQFFPTPARLRNYLAGRWQGAGHNPLGAFSVFGLLALLLFQAGSGLFANDDIAFTGYLYDLVGKELSDRLTGWHKLSANVLFALVSLHVGAIVFYAHVKKDNLVKPMLTGWQDGEGVSARGGGVARFIAAALFAAAVAFGASGAWMPPPPPPPPAAETPAW
ncbi:MAG: cytochrome B [Betaproteobacteria bacterium]|nr:cytochrome B [Betaproteobacteria bacterium]